MHNSKIYTILTHFTKVEQNRLRKFLLSPYFNKSKLLLQLYEILAKKINSTSEKPLSKEKIWKKIYGPETYDDVRFRKLCSDLLKLVEDFLAQERFQNNKVAKSISLLEAVNERKIEKLFNSAKRQAITQTERLPHQFEDYYFSKYQIQTNVYNAMRFALDRRGKSNVDKILGNLDNFYILEKLKYYNTVLSRQNFVSFEFNTLLINEIVESLTKKNEIIPQIKIYLKTLLLQKEEKENYYEELKILLTDHIDKFPNQEANEIYTYAINYCIRRLNRGSKKFESEFLLLNEDLLKRGIIGKGGLSPWKFQNIVTVACRSGRYEWTKNFIENYKDQLPDDYRENAVTYNLARLYFYQKKYTDVVSLLQFVEYEDIGYNLGSKAILLRTYYEIDEQEPLDSLLDAFRTYLNRHKDDISAQRRNNFLNLIKFVRRLTRIIPGDKKAIEKFKKELASTDAIAAEKSWLEEKITELE